MSEKDQNGHDRSLSSQILSNWQGLEPSRRMPDRLLRRAGAGATSWLEEA